MVWDGKDKGVISRPLASLPVQSGGLNGINLHAVLKASRLSVITRAMQQPDSIWAILMREILNTCHSRTKGLQVGKCMFPLIQCVSSSRPLKVDGVLRETWVTWQGEYGNKGGTKPLEPSQKDWSKTCFWYHPSIVKHRDNARGAGIFSTSCMHELAVGLHGTMNTPYDLLQLRDQLKELQKPEAKPQLLREINRLLELVGDFNAFDYGICQPFVTVTTVQGAGNIETLSKTHEMNFKIWYETLTWRKSKDLDLPKIRPGIMEVGDKRHPFLAEAKVWEQSRSKRRKGKLNDFIWRLLHDRVLTGNRLSWLEVDQQRCDLCLCENDLEHIFLKCPKVSALWEYYASILAASGTIVYIPTSLDDIIVNLIIPVGGSGPERDRTNLLFSVAIWTIWRSYTRKQFGEGSYTRESIGTAFFKEVERMMMRERAAALCTYPSKGKAFTKISFKRTWGFAPESLPILIEAPFITKSKFACGFKE